MYAYHLFSIVLIYSDLSLRHLSTRTFRTTNNYINYLIINSHLIIKCIEWSLKKSSIRLSYFLLNYWLSWILDNNRRINKIHFHNLDFQTSDWIPISNFNILMQKWICKIRFERQFYCILYVISFDFVRGLYIKMLLFIITEEDFVSRNIWWIL